MTAEYWEDPVGGYFNWWSGHHPTSAVQTLDLYMKWRDGAELPPIDAFPNLRSVIVPFGLATDELFAALAATPITALAITMGEGEPVPARVFELVRLRSLDLSGLGFTELPDRFDELPELAALDLKGNPLAALPPTLLRAPALRELAVDIAALPPVTAPLERLELACDVLAFDALPATLQHLEAVTTRCVGRVELPALRTLQLSGAWCAPLDLSRTGLERVSMRAPFDEVTLDYLPDSIQSLRLGTRGMAVLSPLVSRFAKLRELDVAMSEIAALPHELHELPLESFNASSTKLADTPTYAYLPDTLVDLSLANVKMTRWPKRLLELHKLKKLSLSVNRLGTVADLRAWPELVELLLDEAGITALPETIGTLSKLRRLHLRLNELTALPTAIVNLPELDDLDIVGNRLRQIPDAVRQMRGRVHLQDHAQRI